MVRTMAPTDPFNGREEDPFDRFFNRPLARPLAHLFASWGWHPNWVTMVGLLVGVAAGWFWQFVTWERTLPGVLLLAAATILDNADGMVARLTGKSSEFGKILDGVCDNFVFGSIYLFSAIAIWSMATPLGGTYGWWTVPLVGLGVISHSHQSAMMDFYKLEWKYWALGNDGARFRSPEELQADLGKRKGLERTFLRLLLGHAKEQVRLSPTRQKLMGAWAPHRSEATFPDAYASRNALPMQGWYIMGPNWHLFSAMVFGLLGRMDLYFIAQFTVFNVILLWSMGVQARADQALHRTLERVHE